MQQIVPLSVSQSVTCTTATLKTQCIASGAEPEKAEPAFAQKVIVRKDGIEVEIPPGYIRGASPCAAERAERMLKDLTADNIYIVCGHTDMRKSIDGLAALVQQQFQLDLFTSSAFLFCGRRRDCRSISQRQSKK